jgi:NTE family protein
MLMVVCTKQGYFRARFNMHLIPHGFRLFAGLFLVAVLAGCASTAHIKNTQITEMKPVGSGQVTSGHKQQRSPDLAFFVAFSGGGTRAAAFSYGVLEELRDTRFMANGEEGRLLDQIDGIASVSGGSFTAAYYGLFGDRIFEDYETAFLRRNVQKTLIASLFNPVNWFRGLFAGLNRTEMAIDYYDKNIFRGSTFADVHAAGGPALQINATDLSIGGRFSFNQEQFNLLCSDLDTFSVARAVAASSAVPVAFTPITLENFGGCDISDHPLMKIENSPAEGNARRDMLLERAESYADKEQRPYIHLVDGGISDNLGIRTAYDRVQGTGGASGFVNRWGSVPKNIAFIIVNAETDPVNPMDRIASPPSSKEVLGAVTNTQIARYNIESRALMEESVRKWAEELSSQQNEVNVFLIYLDFDSIMDMDKRRYFNSMATSFSLPNDEVDSLIAAGHELLQGSPEFQAFVAAIGQEGQ